MLFTLQTFSTTGGIQKMTRTLAHSLHQVSVNNGWDFNLWSVYDTDADLLPQYLPKNNFKGFGSKLSFIIKALKSAPQFDMVIISHINLAIVGRAIKFINPKCKIWLIAHGIEVWRQLSPGKTRFLKNCDKVICVSNFTKQEVITKHQVEPARCEVLNNVVDPFMKLPANFTKPPYLLNRYGLVNNSPVLFTLTRLNTAEQYKGYEQVIKVVSNLKHAFPAIKYVISGASDLTEESRVKKIIAEYEVEEQVILTGFVNEDELADHFLMADLFVLPSRNEGFGIVFIEALACGLPVVCGNVDGSVDAIKNGALGRAVNPDDLTELETTLANCLNEPFTDIMRKNLQEQCLHYFNEADYIKNLNQLLNHEFAG